MTKAKMVSRCATAAAAIAAAVVTIAGCGSSAGQKMATTTTTGSMARSGDTSGALTRAGQQAMHAATAPAKIEQTTPLTSRPPAKTLVYLHCDNAACADIDQGEQAAAQALGWHYRVIDYSDADPSSLITAFHTALQYHPFAVSLSGVAEPTWSSVLSQYEAAGVRIIPTTTTASITSTVPVVIGSFYRSGEDIGDYFIQDSGGHGDALLVNLPAYPVLTQYVSGVKHVIAQNCSTCQTTSFNGTFAELGNQSFVPAIVTQLRKNPQIKYVIVSADLLIPTLPSALKAAGLEGIKVLGGQPLSSDVADIKTGAETGATQLNNVLIGWTVLDSAARLSLHMKVPADDGGIPDQLITKGNITSTDEAAYGIPRGYEAQFKRLWHVGAAG
jgi:ABC-type sugar transport system substrate-binding protein